MPAFSATALISAPPAAVWPHLANVVEWPTWLPTVTTVEPLATSTLVVGSEYRVAQPKLKTTRWKVCVLDPGRSFAWEAQSPGLTMCANHTVLPETNDSSRVTLEFRLSGLLAPLVALLVRGIIARYLDMEAAALKARTESSEGRGA